MLRTQKMHLQKQVSCVETNATIESPYLSNDFIWNGRKREKNIFLKREKCFL